MIIRKPLLLIILICLLVSCSQTNHKYCRLTGHLRNIKDGSVLNLVDCDSGKVIQIMVVKSGKFKTELYLPEPRYFAIYSDDYKLNKNTLLLWLENTDIQIHGDFDDFCNAKVNGSKSNRIRLKYHTIANDYERTLQKLQNAQDVNNQTIRNLQNKYKSDLLNFYSTHNKSYIAFYFLATEIYQYLSPLAKSDIEKLFNDFPENFKNSSMGFIIKKYLSLHDSPKIGDKFIDCILQTPEGVKDSISGHLGKYTLIQFWAATCQPSRGELPILKKIYKAYHNRGLNIIGISGDTKSKEWKDAIQQDSIPWINMSDLNGYYNEAFMIYGVKNTPSLILLDQNGLILENNISRSDLTHYMNEKFESMLFIYPLRK